MQGNVVRLSIEYALTPLAELKQLDGILRHEVEVMTRAKVRRNRLSTLLADMANDRIQNDYTEQCIEALRRISTLNVDLVQLPTALSQLQTKFRTKTNFSHIQRLHNMLYSYGATVIEIVRRKEFGEGLIYGLSNPSLTAEQARFFYQRAQSILEVMAKLSWVSAS